MTRKWATRGGWAPTRYSFDIRYHFLNQDIPPKHHCRGAKQWNVVRCFEKIPSPRKTAQPLENSPSQRKSSLPTTIFHGLYSLSERIGTGGIFGRSPAKARRETARSLSHDRVMWNRSCRLMFVEEWWGAFGCNMLHLLRRCPCLGWVFWTDSTFLKHMIYREVVWLKNTFNYYCNGTYQSPRESCENTQDLHMFTFMLLVTNVVSLKVFGDFCNLYNECCVGIALKFCKL